jgi:hypothetical protein
MERMGVHIDTYRRNVEIYRAALCRGESSDGKSFHVDKTPLVMSWGVGHCIRAGKEGIITVFVDTDIARRVNVVCDKLLPSTMDVDDARRIFSRNPFVTLNIAYSPDGRKFTVKTMSIEGIDPSFEPIDPSIIYDKGKFRVFFFNANQGGIYSCSSSDGIRYMMEPGIRVPYKPTADLVVFRFGKIYRIFWNGIYSATSKNGMDFELDKGVLFVGGGSHIYPDRDGYYKMLYSVARPEFRGTWRARSKDGVTWIDDGKSEIDNSDVFLVGETGYEWYVKKVLIDSGEKSPPENSRLLPGSVGDLFPLLSDIAPKARP